MNFWKKCPLLFFLLISGFIISVVSLANMNGIYRDFEKKTVMTPALAAFFGGIREGKYPWTVWNEQTAETLAQGNGDTPNTVAVPAEKEYEADDDERMTASSEEEETSDNLQETGEKPEGAPDREEELAEAASENEEDQREDPDIAAQEGQDDENASELYDGDGSESAAAAIFETETETEAVVWQLGRVEEEYFDDALFIGDSRTQGLYEYGGFGENVTFYCKTSLTVYDLFKKGKAFIKEDGRNITLEQALTEHSFKKIYLMIGINEIGTGTAESFFEEYARTVFRIQQLQPEAIIFVQGIMRVGAQKNATDPIFNNTNIAIRNVEIQTLADDQRIFYIDVNEAVCDENGNLFEGWSSDQIHLKAKYYAVWKEFLLNHGAIEKEEKIS